MAIPRITPKTRLFLWRERKGGLDVWLFRFVPGRPFVPHTDTLRLARSVVTSDRAALAEMLWLNRSQGWWTYEQVLLPLGAHGRVLFRPRGGPYLERSIEGAYGTGDSQGNLRWRDGNVREGNWLRGVGPTEAREHYGIAVDEMFETLAYLTGERFPDGAYE